MINLILGTANDFVVTLKEKQTLETPTFLFVFTNVATGDEYAVILPDLSSYTYRYNEFTLTLPTDIDIVDIGQYTYTIYEQIDPSNLDPDMADNQLEIGKMLLKDSADIIATKTEKYYTP